MYKKHQRAIDFIAVTIATHRQELIKRLGEVHDIHFRVSRDENNHGSTRRVSSKLAASAWDVKDWLIDPRLHPSSIAIWAAEDTSRLVQLLGACAHVTQRSIVEVEKLLD